MREAGLASSVVLSLFYNSWFQITKDEFDSKAKYLMGENNIQLHNDFLFAMLVKCQTGSLPPQPAGG